MNRCVWLVALSLATGCDSTPAPPVPPPAQGQAPAAKAATPAAPAPAASQPSAQDIAALKAMVADKAPPTPAPAAAPSKPKAPDASGAAALPPGHPPVPGLTTELKFDAPADWKSQPPRSGMRKAQYVLPRAGADSEDGELVVYYFGPGEGGGVADNLNRWRGQFTTADGGPVGDDAVSQETFEAHGMRVTWMDVKGRFAPGPMPGMPATGPRDDYRMFAAIIETPTGPWFIKATGPLATMEQHAAGVRAFTASARP